MSTISGENDDLSSRPSWALQIISFTCLVDYWIVDTLTIIPPFQYPGAFNMTTGPAHWEALSRSRALDNQVYVATVSPARDDSASYVAWGHSTVMDPWGSVVAKTDEKEGIVYADIDLEKLKTIRDQVPITKQRRHDLYDVVAK